MTPWEFIKKYSDAVIASTEGTGLFPSVKMAQLALETGWGKSMPNNMLFGVKADTNWKGKKQLLKTTEVLKSPDIEFPVIISISKRSDGKYDYIVKDWFRVYSNPIDSLKDHINFLKSNKRYTSNGVFSAKTPVEQCIALQKAGYSTSPYYANSLVSIIDKYDLESLDKKKS